jgi:predicted PurR-regulated permease PerM
MKDRQESQLAPPPPETAPAPPGGPPLEDWQDFPSRFARLFFGALTLLVLYYSYEIIKPYLTDIFLSLVLFFTARPLHRGLTRALFGLRALASFLTCLLLALVILLPLFTLVSIIANQALEFSAWVSKGLESGALWQYLTSKAAAVKEFLKRLNLPLPPEQFKLEDVVKTVLTNASAFIYSNAVSLLKGFTGFLMDLALILFVTFFLFLQGEDFIEEIKKLSPLDPRHNEEIVAEMEATIKATLWSTVVVAFIQGALGGLGFYLTGVPQAAFWGTVMIPASVIPVVGAALIWVPAVVYLIFQGAWTKAVGLALFFILVVGSIDNLLKPWLMKGTRPTPAIFIMFSILGGISYFGVIGFIIGPLILSFLLSLLNIYRLTILAAHAQQAPTAAPTEDPRQREG